MTVYSKFNLVMRFGIVEGPELSANATFSERSLADVNSCNRLTRLLYRYVSQSLIE
jgi:hypothetical protein